MSYGKFIGCGAPEILFRKALLRPDPRSRRHVLAQFDWVKETPDAKREGRFDHPLCFHWHRFKRRDFVVLGRARAQGHWRKLFNEDTMRRAS